ncbi:MAG: hypothetical protein JWP72_2694 [Massilia sp.]|nr:hypothetical protein [Massilia sp.]
MSVVRFRPGPPRTVSNENANPCSLAFSFPKVKALASLVVKKERCLQLASSEQLADTAGASNHLPGTGIGRRFTSTEQVFWRCLRVSGKREAINPHSFFSLNSPSITVSPVLLGEFWPVNLKKDDNIRSNIARLNQGNVRRKAVAKPVNTAGTYSPRDRKFNKQSASMLTMSGRRTGLGNRPTMRSLPLLIQGNLAKRPPRSSPAMTRPVPR